MKIRKQRRWKRRVMMGCMGILVAALASIAVRSGTKDILMERLHMNNRLTQAILFDKPSLWTKDKQQNSTQDININWQEKYPFTTQDNDATHHKENPLEKFMNLLAKKPNRHFTWGEKNFIGYNFLVHIGKMYQTEILGHKFLALTMSTDSTPYTNGVRFFNDGYLTRTYKYNQNMQEYVDSLNFLYRICEENQAKLLFVQAPFKVEKDADKSINGVYDFSNQNMDDLLTGLAKDKIHFIDMRAEIKKAFPNREYHTFFFQTDHHWRQTTALWAAGVIAEWLNKYADFSIDTAIFSRANYEQKVYPQHALGSEGRIVTLALAQPEDFPILIPKYKTKILYEIPSLGIHEEGTFMLNYDMKLLNSPDYIDYQNQNMYNVYNHGDNALIRIHNELVHDGKRVLLVKDSFGDTLAPFLAMGVEDTAIIDLRHFTGSLVSFIKDYKPNVVIVLTYPGDGDYSKPIDWKSHKDLFDFR